MTGLGSLKNRKKPQPKTEGEKKLDEVISQNLQDGLQGKTVSVSERNEPVSFKTTAQHLKKFRQIAFETELKKVEAFEMLVDFYLEKK